MGNGVEELFSPKVPTPLQPQKIPVGSALISRNTAPKSGVGARGSYACHFPFMSHNLLQ